MPLKNFNDFYILGNTLIKKQIFGIPTYINKDIQYNKSSLIFYTKSWYSTYL